MQTHLRHAKVALQPIPSIPPRQNQPAYGIFEVHANNSKRRGGRSVKYVDAFGSLYPDGTVHIHTRELQIIDFTSLRHMREYLTGLGDVRIVWLAGPLASQVEEE